LEGFLRKTFEESFPQAPFKPFFKISIDKLGKIEYNIRVFAGLACHVAQSYPIKTEYTRTWFTKSVIEAVITDLASKSSGLENPRVTVPFVPSKSL